MIKLIAHITGSLEFTLDQTGLRIFRAGTLPWDEKKLVIGTSRTKYLKEKAVGATIHSYRGATVGELALVVAQYPPLDLQTVVLVAGFNDHRTSPAHFRESYRILIDLISYKFKPNTIVAPKIIPPLLDNLIARKLYFLNLEVFNLYANFRPGPYIVSPVLCISPKMYCRDGVHFSRIGNLIFSSILNNFFNMF